MKISYAAHKEIQINDQRPTVIATNNPTVYHDLIVGLGVFDDKVKMYDDSFNAVGVKDAVDWQGDVGLNGGVSENIIRIFSNNWKLF